MVNTFESHHIDIHTTGGLAQLRDQLSGDGIATFSGIDRREDALALVREISTVVRHRHGDGDGVTAITGDGDEHRPGYAAFTSRELPPHTEGSALPQPPTLLTMVCLRPAAYGGESSLVDGKALRTTLADGDPDALHALTAPRSAYFGGAAGHLGSVFEAAGQGRMAIRLRLDELARFSPDATLAVRRLTTLIGRYQSIISLRAGQGYVIQNGRWLHGRTRFHGDRMMLRILSNPRPPSPIRYGFNTTHT